MKSIHDIKEFFLSSWAIDNRITTYMLTAIVTLVGIWSFNNLPKENFPEIAIPMIYIGTPYPGNSPENIEKNVTFHIEKALKSIKGVKKIKSQSVQDFSVIIVEFETNVDLKEAKREVQDAVSRAKSELPNDLDQEPLVQDINLSEIPIMSINVSGDLPPDVLKRYSEELQDMIETLPEIRRADLLGVQEKEVQVNIDLFKMQANQISFGDVQAAIGSRDVLISGGTMEMGEREYALQVAGKFTKVEQIENVVMRNSRGEPVYLKDIAEVKLDFKELDSYARLDGLPTISLNVIKKAGENLVEASEKINVLLDEFQNQHVPADMRDQIKIKISADQSYLTRNMLDELFNTIIVGFVLVTLTLVFFMGITDSIFVGLSVPLASLIAFTVLPWIGFTLNLVVLFTFIFALGIVVDNAIVVVENTYRLYNGTKEHIIIVAKKAAGEVIVPVLAGTFTVMAPFLPLAFWDGVVGEFMFFLPITIIITLIASILVAYVINPVFSVAFMRRGGEYKGVNLKGFLIILAGIVGFGGLLHLMGAHAGGNSFLMMGIIITVYRFALAPVIKVFQRRTLPWIVDLYRASLRWTVRGRNAWWVVIGTFVTFILSVFVFAANPPKVVFFPESDPNFIYIYAQLPIGTQIEKTNQVTMQLEEVAYRVLEGKDNPIVKSVITNVAKGAGSPSDFNQSSVYTNKSRIQIEFVPYKERNGASTAKYLEDMRAAVKDIAGAIITVEKEENGPPTAKPINLEIKGEDFGQIQGVAAALMTHLDSLADEGMLNGVEELKWDIDVDKPEIALDIDHVKAEELGMTTAQIGMAVRTAVFGTEISKFREGEDEYPIMVRLGQDFRKNLDAVHNMNISYMDMATARFKSIPLSAVARVRDTVTFGGINRLDLKKVVTVSSNVLSDYNPTEVVQEVIGRVETWRQKNSHLLNGVSIDMTGELKEQEETGAFLGRAMLASLIIIFLILIAQFNSVPKVMIIFSQIILSLVGVFFGFGLSGMDFSIVMGGVGMVSLAGMAVNNGILLLDFIQTYKERGYRTRYAIVEGSASRFIPVQLTAWTTVFGLVPLAIAMNIDFVSLFTEFNPHLFFGGDTADFWGPLSWTIIYGLGFATIVTLLFVPAAYYLFLTHNYRFVRMWRRVSRRLSEGMTK